MSWSNQRDLHEEEGSKLNPERWVRIKDEEKEMGWIWERSLLARWKCHSKGQREEWQVAHPMSGHIWTEERVPVGFGGSVPTLGCREPGMPASGSEITLPHSAFYRQGNWASGHLPKTTWLVSLLDDSLMLFPLCIGFLMGCIGNPGPHNMRSRRGS